MDMRHMDFIDAVRASDVDTLRKKEATYQGSWKRAGGRSAWFMARRNMDRLLAMMAPSEPPETFRVQNVKDLADNINEAPFGGGRMIVQVHASTHTYAEDLWHMCRAYSAEDIFAKIAENPGGEDGTVLACVRDLRCYLTLVEAEMMARGVVSNNTPPTPPTPMQKSYHDMTNDELRAERAKLAEANEKATGWGAAVGVRGEFIQEIDGILLRRESVKPGTPEDGGHHSRAETWPWVVAVNDADKIFDEQCVSTEMRDLFWTRRGQNYVLDAHVKARLAPVSLGPYLKPLGSEEWLVHIDRIPDYVRRERFPSLTRELNAKEYSERPRWQRDLYTFDEGGNKYVLSVEAWHCDKE